MRTRRYTRLPGMTLAVMLTLLVGQGLVFGHDDGDRTAPSKLEGTWNVTLQLGRCDASCLCPPGITTDTLIPALQMFLKHGFYLEAPVGPSCAARGWDRGSASATTSSRPTSSSSSLTPTLAPEAAMR